jgi:hypothetical protein
MNSNKKANSEIMSNIKKVERKENLDPLLKYFSKIIKNTHQLCYVFIKNYKICCLKNNLTLKYTY